MLRCLQSPENFIGNGGADMTVLERLRERLLWLQQLQQQQQLQSYYQQQQQPQQNHGIQNNSYQKPLFDRLDNNDFGSFMLDRTDKMGFSSSEIATNSSLEEMDNSFSRGPCNFPPVAAAATKTFDMEKAKVTPTMGRDSLKKRKAEIGVTDYYCKEKRIKEDVDETESSKVTEKTNKGSSTTTTTTSTSKDNSKASDVKKQDYIHVRARRGQATDNHSIAERARREKIGKKMKCLQDLVPGCNKITGKAGMLDEIINYVQSLQGQVEFLSMKLASLNPRLDFNNGNLFAKEFPAYAANFPAAALCSPEMANLASLQFNAMQQGAQNCVLDMQMNPKQLPAHKTTTATSSSVSVPEMYLEQTSSITQVQPFSAWDTDLQNLYNVEFQ